MKKLFGTDGIRGEAGKFPLDEKTIKIIGSSLAKHLGAKLGKPPRFVIGRDTRISGEWIERAFSAGSNSKGASYESAGIIPTPGIAYLTKAEKFDAGIVISASHNPFQDNGVKVFLPTGQKLDENTERAIEEDIFEGNDDSADSSKVDLGKVEEFQKRYLDSFLERFNGLDLKNFRIIVDCANGAASDLAPDLFKRFGADVIAINNKPDGENINRDCGSLHLESLQETVLAENAAFGVAFDGDADRSLFVDENGGLVDGDATLWVMAQHLKRHGELKNDAVVATVMSNIGLEIALKSKNISLIRTSVGDKYVLEELLKTGASVGGEQSGHIIFPEHSLVGDGMQTALFLMETMAENNKTLSELREGFVQYPQILVNVKVSEKRPFEEVVDIANAAREIENELGKTGRLLLRYSGTENLARVMIEGQDQTEIESQANRLANVIGQSLS